MKKFLLLVALMAGSLFAQDLTGPEIIQKVNELMNQESVEATMTMTIETTSGQTRTFEYLSYSKNKGEKNLMIYLAPKRVKGQKMLMLNNADDIWAYFARTKRVRKLASHAKKQKFEGSDFSNEDMGASNTFITDFETTLVGSEKYDSQECYKINLDRKDGASSSYAKMVMWVLKDNYYPIVVDYYHEDNPDKVQKTLVQNDIQTIDGVPTAMIMEMQNRSDNSKTVMTMKDVKYNVDLADELFTERGLKK